MKHDLRAFLADTNHMSPAQLGAFVLLRDKMIISGGRLPNDDYLLARVARVRDVRTFRTMRPVLGLRVLDDGTVTLDQAEKLLTEALKHQKAEKQAVDNSEILQKCRQHVVQARLSVKPGPNKGTQNERTQPTHAHEDDFE